ncbi:hypothetical protein FRC07_011813, partial [Ceratobasidium sp. 392]
MLTPAGFWVVLTLQFALAVAVTRGAMWCYDAVTSHPWGAITVCVIILGLSLTYREVKRKTSMLTSGPNSKSEDGPERVPQSAPAPPPGLFTGPDLRTRITDQVVLALTRVIFGVLFVLIAVPLTYLSVKAIKCYPLWSALVFVLLFCLSQYVLRSQGEPDCTPNSEPPCPYIADMAKAHREGARCTCAEPEPEPEPELPRWRCGPYPKADRLSRAPLERGNYTGLGSNTGYGARYTGTSYAGSFGQPTRHDLDPPRRSNDWFNSEPRFDHSTLVPRTRDVSREIAQLQPPVFGSKDAIKSHKAISAIYGCILS